MASVRLGSAPRFGVGSFASLALLLASVLGSRDSQGCSQPGSSSPFYGSPLNSSSTHSVSVPDPRASDGRATVTRTFRIHLPADALSPTAGRAGDSGASRHPLWIDFHGWGDTGASEEAYLSRLAMPDSSSGSSYIFVYPDGADDNSAPGSWGSWNASGTVGSPGAAGATCALTTSLTPVPCYNSCSSSHSSSHSSFPLDPSGNNSDADTVDRDTPCADGCAWTTCYDDVAFLHALLDVLSLGLCIDRDRVFVTGMSNGGLMAYHSAASTAFWTPPTTAAARLRAVSPVSGLPHFGFASVPAVPTPLLHIHGLGDRTIPPGPCTPEDVADACEEVRSSSSSVSAHQAVPGRAAQQEAQARRDKVLVDPRWRTVSWDGYYYTSASLLVALYGELNKCDLAAVPTPGAAVSGFVKTDDLSCLSLVGCVQPVVLCSWSGPHTWPPRWGETVNSFFQSLPDPPTLAPDAGGGGSNTDAGGGSSAKQNESSSVQPVWGEIEKVPQALLVLAGLILIAVAAVAARIARRARSPSQQHSAHTRLHDDEDADGIVLVDQGLASSSEMSEHAQPDEHVDSDDLMDVQL